jgi:hypothetical protein
MIAASIGLGLKSDRIEEALQRAAHGGIVDDDVHKGLLAAGCRMPSAMHP